MVALQVIKDQVNLARQTLQDYVEFGSTWQDLEKLSEDLEAVEDNLQINIDELKKYVANAEGGV